MLLVMTLLPVPNCTAARCTGKTDVRNIEPEDLRAITLASARAFGVPLAGAKRGTVIEAAE